IGGTIFLQEQNVLNQLLGNDAVEENGSYYFVVGPKGTLLFHPDTNQIGKGVYENPVVRQLTLGNNGMELITNTSGLKMLAAYSYVSEAKWGIVQQTPYSFVQDLLLEQLRQTLKFVLIPFLILLLFSIFIARKLAAPFIQLGNLVNGLAEGKNQQLTESAVTDSLTGLPNRRKLEEVLAEWASDKQQFSMLVLDIDHFKSINDAFGHQTGDETLKKLAETVQAMLGDKDHCF